MIEQPNRIEEPLQEEQLEASHLPVSVSPSESPSDTANAPSEMSETDASVAESTEAAAQRTPDEIMMVLSQEITNLQQELAEQRQQGDALKTRYISLAAEFDNFRKRTQKEKQDLEIQVKCQTLRELLGVVDNFERARTQIKPDDEGEAAIHNSYQSVYKNLVDSLKRLGVSAMNPKGEPFDPVYHEAMLQEPSSEYPEGTVLDQLVRGYLLGDQVLRHALVKVATTAESDSGVETEVPAQETTEESSA